MQNLKTNLLLIKISFLFVVFCNAVVDVAHKVLLQNIAFKIFDGSEQVVWISIINAMIIIPFLLLFTLSGYLSDKYDKKSILIYGAISSFVLSVLMIFSYLSGNFYLAMANLILLAIQSAIYSPAKFGIILTIWGKKNLSSGNSALQAVSIIAILFAIASGSFVFESFYNTNNLALLTSKEALLDAIMPLTLFIAPIGFLEMLVSVFVLRRLKTAYVKNENLSLDKKALFQGKLLKRNINKIYENNIIFLSVVGLSVFWGVSQGLMAVFPSFAKEYLAISDVFVINGVIAASGIGIAIGSAIYSRLSRNYIEVGTIPFSAIGMSVMIFLSTQVSSAALLAASFLLFGIFGGMFVVPLNSLIQFNAKKRSLGTILAGNNWFHSLAMFLMLSMTTIVSLNKLDPLNTIYLILFITIIGMFYTIYKLPQSLLLLFMKFIIGIKYKLEVQGVKHIPSSGGALLLGNHISWIDWAVILMSSPREIKFVMHKPIYEKWYLNWIFRAVKAIPISSNSSKETIKKVANELDNGSIVVLFPEGSITRNGHLGEFKRGFELILKQTKTDVPVIPFYIRGLWESMFSRANKKYKKSKRVNCVTVSFAKAIKKKKANVVSVKKAVKTLSTSSWKEHTESLATIPELIFDRLKQIKSDLVFADTTGVELSGYKFLTASILFKNIMKKRVKGQNVALLLPSSAGAAFLNTSVLMLGRTAINLNFTASIEALKGSVKKAEVQTIITSKKFVEKLKERGVLVDEVLELCEVLYVEDMKRQISKAKGLMTLLGVITLPTFLLKDLHIKARHKDDTALIMFSSGSEGVPKGIELSHKNVVGNSQQIASVLNVDDNDVIVGSLPFFHAFGTVVTLFLPLIEGIRCVSHPDPTDGFAIGNLVKKYKATIMLGTSTFFRLYTKNSKTKKEMFSSLRLIVAGAEKLSLKVREEFEAKFDKKILEGFGTTETTPVASCNLPDMKDKDGEIQVGGKIGSVGMAIPGTKFKIVNPESFEELETEQEGMILICGVQVMKGYLKDEKKTKEALVQIKGETYYVTGDKGRLDKDGFLTIVDRYSRFAKLGGEMVSLGAVEESVRRVLANDEMDIVVSAIKDDKKGEKIVALISNINEEELKELKKRVIESFDNNLMIPSIYKIVETVPKLGSGKTDFKLASKMAQES